jgi:predicted RND superfamily exporter protein
MGFGALSLSQFPPNRTFGQLVSLNMAICLLSTVTLLAALLHSFNPKFLRRS